MRITGGALRGRVVPGNVGRNVRPTASRVREALFSMVGQDLDGWAVLDAFGGSGLLAFEAASRGARVTVVECERRTAVAIGAAAEALGIAIDLRVMDAAHVLGTETWDLILLDPPYDADPAEWADRAAPSVRRVLVVEHRHDAQMPERVGALVMDRARRYGNSALTVYRPGALTGAEEADIVVDDATVVEDQG